uniref:Uncharacterized protein n=1 Tax=Eutreptiella gymnastica TaxID=73025 RepID=A0A7S1IAK5_9EUGL|mmetsp:Transcript_142979/g.249511  ORF Transcript_142979/g.249511 Transcript_142979/m.249511 type:complete len:413 (+) Transcript_142979:62-1300(+)
MSQVLIRGQAIPTTLARPTQAYAWAQAPIHVQGHQVPRIRDFWSPSILSHILAQGIPTVKASTHPLGTASLPHGQSPTADAPWAYSGALWLLFLLALGWVLGFLRRVMDRPVHDPCAPISIMTFAGRRGERRKPAPERVGDTPNAERKRWGFDQEEAAPASWGGNFSNVYKDDRKIAEMEVADGWMEREGENDPWTDPWANAEGWGSARASRTKGSRQWGPGRGYSDQAPAYSLDTDYDGVWGDVDASERGWSSVDDTWLDSYGHEPGHNSPKTDRSRRQKGAAVRYYRRYDRQAVDRQAGYGRPVASYTGDAQTLQVAAIRGEGDAQLSLPPCTDEDADDDWYNDPEDEEEEVELNEYGFSMVPIEGDRMVPRHSPNPGIGNDLHMPLRPDGKGWRDDSVEPQPREEKRLE